MLRIGLIGCGSHSGRGHAGPLSRFVSQNPGVVELTAVCDLQPERAHDFASRYGFGAAYSDLEVMLKEQRLDGVVCVMPVDCVVSVTGRLLARGIPCVIEKPFGCNMVQARELAQIARRHNTPHQVSLNRRFMPQLNEAKKWAASRGAIRYVRATMLRSARTEPEFLWATGVHAVDAACYLGGGVKDYRVEAGEDQGTCWRSVNLGFAGAAIGRVDICPTAGADEECYELMGEGYWARVSIRDASEVHLQCWQANRLVVSAQATTPRDEVRGEYGEVVAFVDALQGKVRFKPSIEDVLPSLAICWAMQTGFRESEVKTAQGR